MTAARIRLILISAICLLTLVTGCQRWRLVLAADEVVMEFLLALKLGDNDRLRQTFAKQQRGLAAARIDLRAAQFRRELGSIKDHLRTNAHMATDGSVVLEYQVSGEIAQGSLRFVLVPTREGWRINEVLKIVAF